MDVDLKVRPFGPPGNTSFVWTVPHIQARQPPPNGPQGAPSARLEVLFQPCRPSHPGTPTLPKPQGAPLARLDAPPRALQALTSRHANPPLLHQGTPLARLDKATRPQSHTPLPGLSLTHTSPWAAPSPTHTCRARTWSRTWCPRPRWPRRRASSPPSRRCGPAPPRSAPLLLHVPHIQAPQPPPYLS